MFCIKCGAANQDDSRFCTTCGAPLKTNIDQYKDSDIPSTGLKVLSFFIPIVGLILYIVWNNSYPDKARSCGKWALISIIVSTILYFAYGCSVATLLASTY